MKNLFLIAAFVLVGCGSNVVEFPDGKTGVIPNDNLDASADVDSGFDPDGSADGGTVSGDSGGTLPGCGTP